MKKIFFTNSHDSQKHILTLINVISVNKPLIAKNARKYVLDCINTGWVSSGGKYIEKFEQEFSSYIGTRYALTTSSGTSALHLALASLGIGKNDEVIMPDLTIIACALAAVYVGAKPVLVDVESKTGNIDPAKIEEKITKKTKAIMVVHLYGHPANMDPIINLAKKYKLFLIEDAAEAHGAQILIKNKTWVKTGSVGNVSCFSFYGNKIVTTGEGGMLVTNSKRIYHKAKLLKDLAHSPKRRFWHEELGYNFRMTNMQAALGLAQLEEIEKYLNKKRAMAQLYNKNLQTLENLELPSEEPWSRSVYWMYAVKVKAASKISRNLIRKKLFQQGIDTRDFFIPLHQQPVLKKLGFIDKSHFPISDDLSLRGFYLPSGLAITKSQIITVCDALKKLMSQ